MLLLAGPAADRVAVPGGVATAGAAGPGLGPGGLPGERIPALGGAPRSWPAPTWRWRWTGWQPRSCPPWRSSRCWCCSPRRGSPDLRTARFHGLMLLFVAAALMTVLATTLPTLLLSWEVMGATSFALIGYHWRDPVTVSSGTTAFLTTRAADLGLYVAAGAALAGGAGSEPVVAAGRERRVARRGGGRTAGRRPREGGPAALLVLAVAGDARTEPGECAAALGRDGRDGRLPAAAGVTDAGGHGVGRRRGRVGGCDAPRWCSDSSRWPRATSSSCSRPRPPPSSATSCSRPGSGATAAGTTHLVAHAAVKAGLFLAAGLWLEALGTKRLSALTGAARTWPVVGACAAAGLLSLGRAPAARAVGHQGRRPGRRAGSTRRCSTRPGLVGAALAAGYAGKAVFVLTRPAPDGVEAGWDEERHGHSPGADAVGRGAAPARRRRRGARCAGPAAARRPGARPRRAAGRPSRAPSSCWSPRWWPAEPSRQRCC